MASYSYTVIFEPLEGECYQVLVPAIPEIITFGTTIEEGRRMAQDAIRCFLESALKTGEAIPADLQPEKELHGVNVYRIGCHHFQSCKLARKFELCSELDLLPPPNGSHVTDS